jgi:hypothetical protein
MDDFWKRFIAWHLDTEHPWDLALAKEASVGSIRADLEPVLWALFRGLFPTVAEKVDVPQG